MTCSKAFRCALPPAQSAHLTDVVVGGEGSQRATQRHRHIRARCPTLQRWRGAIPGTSSCMQAAVCTAIGAAASAAASSVCSGVSKQRHERRDASAVDATTINCQTARILEGPIAQRACSSFS